MTELDLRTVRQDFFALANYLVKRRGQPMSLLSVQIIHSSDADKRNQKSPRGFCHVTPGLWVIFCSQTLEDAPREVRLGVLLHETGHLILDAFRGDESEVDVDEFCLHVVPEAGYYYGDSEYFSRFHGRNVTAKNVQHVSHKFAEIL